MSPDDRTSDADNQLVQQRRDKLTALRRSETAFPNDFAPDSLAGELQQSYAEHDRARLADAPVAAALAGRVLAKRVMGKLSFATLQDRSGRIQLMVAREALGEAAYDDFKQMDIGDIVGACGALTRSNTGELSLRVDALRLLTKALRPLPEKWHGLADREARYRQRYVDLIINPEVKAVFFARGALIGAARAFLAERDYLEVETPMLQAIPGGAAARPFVTRYNALDHDFYLRVAPELYLKRLVVGGLERVFELNRNFRNEGLSTRHNPEFTMLELYQAYTDYGGMMALIESLLRTVSGVVARYPAAMTEQAVGLDRPFERLTLRAAVARHCPGAAGRDLASLDDVAALAQENGIDGDPEWTYGHWLTALFEATVEPHLASPTFVTDYPASVSPLARRRDDAPDTAERFELFAGGREIANGFSELNDAEDQAARFAAQARAKQAGDQEAMYYDADYVTALEHGLPPTAGAGIGIDRLLMLLTGQPAIRDVLLFPQLRPRDG